MTIPLDPPKPQPEPTMRFLSLPPRLTEPATSASWFARADREREAGEQLAALAAYGRAADAALAEKRPMSALDAWFEQAQLWAERGQFDELKQLSERLHRLAYSTETRPLAGGLLRGAVFAHFVTLAAIGQTEPLGEMVLNVRAVRLSGALPKFADFLESVQKAETRFNERLSDLWSLKE